MSKNDWQNVNEILGKLSVCALTKLFASIIHSFQSDSIVTDCNINSKTHSILNLIENCMFFEALVNKKN